MGGLRTCTMMDAATLRSLLRRIVGQREEKARVVQEGVLFDVVACVGRTEHPAYEQASLLAAQVLASVAQHATPPMVLGLVRARAVDALVHAATALASDTSSSAALIEATLRALATVLTAVCDQIVYMPWHGLGSGPGSAMMSGLEHVQALPLMHLSHRPAPTWAAAGPSVATKEALTPERELHAQCWAAVQLTWSHLPTFAILAQHPAWTARVLEPVLAMLRVSLAALARAQPGPIDDQAVSPIAIPPALLDALYQAASIPAMQEASVWACQAVLACSSVVGSTDTLAEILRKASQHTSTAVRQAAYCALAYWPLAWGPMPVSPHTVLVQLLNAMTEREPRAFSTVFALRALLQARSALQKLAVYEHDVLAATISLLDATFSAIPSADAPPLDRTQPCPLRAREREIRMQEGGLYVLATLATEGDAMRRHIIEARPSLLRDRIVPLLACAVPGVQLAACHVCRVLSRTIGLLRTTLWDAHLAEYVLQLLQHGSAMLQTEALALLANLLVKYSPMQTWLLDHGGIDVVVACLRPATPTALQHRALWVLKNALWECEPAIRTRLLTAVPCDTLLAYTHVPEISLRAEALHVLRNATAASTDDEIAAVLARLNASAWQDVLVRSLHPTSAESVLVQAAYLLMNITASGAPWCDVILSEPTLVQSLCWLVQSAHPSLQEAGLRCGLNMLPMPSARDQLKALGYDVAVQACSREAPTTVYPYLEATMAYFYKTSPKASPTCT